MRPLLWLKALLSLALLAWVFSRIDAGAAWQAVVRLPPGFLAASVAMALIAYVARAQRWRLLLERAGIQVRLRTSYRLTLLGVFYGLVTPGRVGEFARIAHLPAARTRSMPSVLWDRLSDVLLLELMAIPGLWLVGARAPVLLWLYAGFVAATLLALWVLHHPAAAEWWARRIPSWRGRLDEWRAGAGNVLWSGAFLRGLSAGVAFYALNFLSAMVLLNGLAPGAPAAFALMFPLIILLGNIPVSIGGLGVREHFAGVALSGLGAAPETGPVFSLLWFMVMTLVPGLAGWLMSGVLQWREAAAERTAGD